MVCFYRRYYTSLLQTSFLAPHSTLFAGCVICYSYAFDRWIATKNFPAHRLHSIQAIIKSFNHLKLIVPARYKTLFPNTWFLLSYKVTYLKWADWCCRWLYRQSNREGRIFIGCKRRHLRSIKAWVAPTPVCSLILSTHRHLRSGLHNPHYPFSIIVGSPRAATGTRPYPGHSRFTGCARPVTPRKLGLTTPTGPNCFLPAIRPLPGLWNCLKKTVLRMQEDMPLVVSVMGLRQIGDVIKVFILCIGA